MSRLVLHFVLVLAVTISPLVCCCARPFGDLTPATDAKPTTCCCSSAPKTPKPTSAPARPCSCKEKQPQGIIAGPSSPWTDAGTLSLLLPDALPLAVLAPVPTQDHAREGLLCPVPWFRDAKARLRALQVLRL